MANNRQNEVIQTPNKKTPFDNFSPKQKDVIAFGNNETSDIILCDGAIRSGKTISVIIGFLLWVIKFTDGKTKDLNFIIAGKTVGSCVRNVIQPMRIVLDWLGYEYNYVINKNVIKMGKITFYIFEGFNESSFEKVQGLTASGCLLDEVALMPQNFVEQCISRCSVKNSKIWLTCNPSNPFHFIKQEYINKAEQKNIKYLHFTMDDNYHLPEKIKQRYKRMYKGVFYSRYILGEWKVAEGLIYPNFQDSHIVRPQGFDFERYYVSIDYGVFNPMVFLLWGKYKNKWYCIKEYFHSGRETNRQKSDLEYYNDLENFLGDIFPQSIIVDPSASSFITLIRKNRKYRVINAKNDVMEGLANTSNALDNKDILFYDSLENTIEEFYTYQWDIKASENGEDRPLKESDHTMDSIRYFVNTILSGKNQARATIGF